MNYNIGEGSINSITLLHAIVYSVIFSAYLLVTLSVYPRLWLRHYPAKERELQAPRTRQERILLNYHAIFFLGGIILALPVLSVLLAYGSDVSSEIVFLHLLTLGILASLVDWLILDWLIIRYIQPSWLIPADTQASSWRSRKEIGKDFAGFVIGSGIALIWAYLVSVFFQLLL